ncbi:MAG: ABC transporter ATP-binding protein [Clostridia bacterium]|nr:ABC transporter ATP-binding protein [Clostridia bacterium]
MDHDIVVEVKDLSVSFFTDRRKNNAIRDVSLTMRRGKTLCVVGESGCGKSVSASAIMRLLPELSRIEHGEITYYGRENPIRLDKLNPDGELMRQLRGEDIAMIFQDPMTALNPVYNIGFQISENLLEHDRKMSKKQAHERSVELLRSMDIPLPEQRVNEYPHQFSGGMRQRAMIAMAMACNPKMLIADEPTTALDVTVQAQIFELMNRLKTEYDTAIMLITHDMGVVTELADDVSVMYMGYIVEEGTVDDVLRHPAHPYTRALLRSIPVLGRGKSQDLQPIRGSTPDPYHRPSGCQFEPRCDFACEECKKAMPERANVEGGHFVRCYRHKEVLASE